MDLALSWFFVPSSTFAFRTYPHITNAGNPGVTTPFATKLIWKFDFHVRVSYVNVQVLSIAKTKFSFP